MYELEHGFLAGRVVDIVYSHLDHPIAPEVEHEGRRYALHRVDPVKNARRARPPRSPSAKSTEAKVDFDPSCTTAPVSAAAPNEEDDDACF